MKEEDSEEETEKEDETASFRRLEDRVRYRVSKGRIERRSNIASGLQEEPCQWDFKYCRSVRITFAGIEYKQCRYERRF